MDKKPKIDLSQAQNIDQQSAAGATQAPNQQTNLDMLEERKRSSQLQNNSNKEPSPFDTHPSDKSDKSDKQETSTDNIETLNHEAQKTTAGAESQMFGDAKTRPNSIQIGQVMSQIKEVNEELYHEELHKGFNQATELLANTDRSGKDGTNPAEPLRATYDTQQEKVLKANRLNEEPSKKKK